MKNFDVIAVGNAIVDEFLTIHDANIHCRLNEKDCELCIAYGEKILLDRLDVMIGGNAANVSVGLSRLGLGTAICAEIGDDEFASKITKALQTEHVDDSLVKRTKNASSSISIGINFKGERTLFVEHVNRTHNFHLDGNKTKWIYLTSLGEEWKDAYDNVLRFVENEGVCLAFNPGTVQLKQGYFPISKILQKTYMLFLNLDEAKGLIASQEKTNERIILDSRGVLEKLHSFGPKIVVMTDGKKGSHVLSQEGNIRTFGIIPAKMVEKTGAGDAYASGFLAGYIYSKDIDVSIKWGTTNAASVIGKIGAQPGLLKKEEIEEKISRL